MAILGWALFKGIVTLVVLVPTLWIAGVPMFPSYPASDWLTFSVSGIMGITLKEPVTLPRLVAIALAATGALMVASV